MNKDTKIIDNIMTVTKIKRQRLQKDAIRFAIKQANGDFWFSEDTNQWEGLDASKAEPLEQSIINRIHAFSSGIVGIFTTPALKKHLPEFITYGNDPRGFVLKIETDKLSDEAKQYCVDTKLARDWGGDYTILTEKELN